MKHAVLIMAHNNFCILKKLLHQLDDEHFDIYVHMDLKASDFCETEFTSIISRARLTFIPRIRVGYCDYSMMEVVVTLMKTASREYHDYYHIISGVDMMIKRRQDFLKFFEFNDGFQFVAFTPNYKIDDRVYYRHFFISKWRQKEHWKSVFYIRLRKFLIALQKMLKLRITPDMEVKKGADWYSITHEAVLYMLTQEAHFKRYFYRSYCPTEFYPQTILWNSKFRNQLYNISLKNENDENMRQIDWYRGSPYTYKSEDYELLINSPYLFARKFDEQIDISVVNRLEDYVVHESQT